MRSRPVTSRALAWPSAARRAGTTSPCRSSSASAIRWNMRSTGVPFGFISALLDAGSNPNYEDHGGFPSIIAALSTERTDKLDIIRILIDHGADPDMRGVNDWTPLHYAVAIRSAEAIHLLLAAGADPALKTRIDDYTTALAEADSGRLRSRRFIAARCDGAGAVPIDARSWCSDQEPNRSGMLASSLLQPCLEPLAVGDIVRGRAAQPGDRGFVQCPAPPSRASRRSANCRETPCLRSPARRRRPANSCRSSRR